MVINDFFKLTFLGNTIANYCWFIGIIIVGLSFQRLLAKFFTFLVFKFLNKYATEVGYNKLLGLLRKPICIFIMLIIYYLAFDCLSFPPEWNVGSIEKFGIRSILFLSFHIAIVLSITWIFLRLVDFFGLILMQRASLTLSKTDDQIVLFIKETIKVIVVVFALFFILGAIFKINVASLIAGLGIGGLAIALAAKESLENLIGSFTIFLDKPFVIGDSIKIGAVEGKVENIGFRSTRIRTLDKSFMTIPNKKMVDNELDNLSHRTQRRANFNIGLSHETKAEQLKNIIDEIQYFIENHPSVLKGETHVRLQSFDFNAINVMVIYFVNHIDYNLFLDVYEEINYKILEILDKKGASLAHSNNIFLEKK